MTDQALLDDGPAGVIVQFLEGGPATEAIDPAAAAARLRAAHEILRIEAVCIGWRLPERLLDAVIGEARRLGASVWAWHPFLSGDGRYVPRADAAVGPLGGPIASPNGMPEFAFDCPLRPAGRRAALERLEATIEQASWDGVFLDKMRWPSPTTDPSTELACFCDVCHDAAAENGVGLDRIATEVVRAGESADGRLRLAAALLGRTDDKPLADFVAYRSRSITAAVGAAARLIRGADAPDGTPLRVAYDVFAPSLALAVGQDLAALSASSTFIKGMLYLGTHGPAGLAYELCRLARWLAEGGVPDPVERLATLLGYPLPTNGSLCSASLEIEAFENELHRLVGEVGTRATAGIDAVSIPEVAVLDDATLERAAQVASTAGLPIVLSWDLWSTPQERLAAVARGMVGTRLQGVRA